LSFTYVFYAVSALAVQAAIDWTQRAV